MPHSSELDDKSRGHLSPRDLELLDLAIKLGRLCVPVTDAFSVGAVIAEPNGRIVSTGFSRELGRRWHAEEVALFKAQIAYRTALLAECYLFSSLEPCSRRLSRSRACCELIVEAGIRRVIFCWKEPAIFVDARGEAALRRAAITTIEYRHRSELVRAANAHLASALARNATCEASGYNLSVSSGLDPRSLGKQRQHSDGHVPRVLALPRWQYQMRSHLLGVRHQIDPADHSRDDPERLDHPSRSR